MFAFCVLIILGVGVTVLTMQVLESLTDEELLAHFNRGNQRAFECLFMRHKRPLYNFILRSVKSQHRAEELMQEVFLKIIQNASGYVREAKFTTWLYTIARNRCIDEYRRAGVRGPSTSTDQVLGDSGTTIGDQMAYEQALSGLRFTASKQIQKALEQAVEALPEDQHETFMLRMVAHLSYQEIAEVTGIPENTAKSRMRYALSKLRDELQKMGFSADDLKES